MKNVVEQNSTRSNGFFDLYLTKLSKLEH